ncbi:MAG TPA: hypothetical protein VFC07_00900 [Verrucomicrobiae bacterium]|nr:hypothetical protein [Verrucomicrobiae bacterium]
MVDHTVIPTSAPWSVLRNIERNPLLSFVSTPRLRSNLFVNVTDSVI